jgi:nucleoside-diphosphate-sugar epimerase
MNSIKRTILVTGGAGFIGRHLVDALTERGHRIRAAVRRHISVFHPSVEQRIIGNIGLKDDWSPLIEGCEVVIHLAAISHASHNIPEEQYNKVNRAATADLARATNQAGARLIFLSSIAAQTGPSANSLLSEADNCRPINAYGRSKLYAERDIASIGGSYIILRPTLVYGTGVKGNMRKLIQLARLPLPLPFGAVNNHRSLLGLQNLLSAIIFFVDREDIRNELFIIADSKPVSLPQMIAQLRLGMGRSPDLISVSPNLLAFFFRMVRMPHLWERLAQDLAVSVDRLKSVGYLPLNSTLDGLAELGAAAVRPRSD